MSTRIDDLRDIEVQMPNGEILVFPWSTPMEEVQAASRRYHLRTSGEPGIPPIEGQGGTLTAATGALTDMDRAVSGVTPAPPPQLGGFFADPEGFIGGLGQAAYGQAKRVVTEPGALGQDVLEVAGAPSRGLGMAISGLEDLGVADRPPLARALESGTLQAGSYVPSMLGGLIEFARSSGLPETGGPFAAAPAIEPLPVSQGLFERSADMAAQAQQIPTAGPQSVFDIKTPEDFSGFLVTTLGKQGPIMAGLLGAGVLGGPAALLPASGLMETGIIAQEQFQATGKVDPGLAAAGGAVAGALEATPIMLWLRRTSLGDDGVRWVGSRARSMLAQAGEEATTEYPQELVEALAAQFVVDNRDKFTDREWEYAQEVIKKTQPQAITAAAGGAFMGLVSGAGTGGSAQQSIVDIHRQKLGELELQQRIGVEQQRGVQIPRPSVEELLQATRDQIAARRGQEPPQPPPGAEPGPPPQGPPPRPQGPSAGPPPGAPPLLRVPDDLAPGGERFVAGQPQPQPQPPMVPPPSARWTGDRGSMPGEPEFFLDVVDQDLETATAAIVRNEDDQGNVEWEGVDEDGNTIIRGADLGRVSSEIERIIGTRDRRGAGRRDFESDRQRSLFNLAEDIITDRGDRFIWATTGHVPPDFLEGSSPEARKTFFEQLEDVERRVDQAPQPRKPAPAAAPEGFQPLPGGGRYRVGPVSAAGGAMLLEIQIGDEKQALYVGRKGEWIQSKNVAFNRPESREKLWIPESAERADQARQLLSQLAQEDSLSPDYDQLRQRLRDLVSPKAVPAAAPAAEAAPKPTPQPPLEVAREKFDNLTMSYSGDRIAGNAIRKPVIFQDKPVVVTGYSSKRAEVYQVVPLEEFQGETFWYGEGPGNAEDWGAARREAPLGFYHGQKIKRGKSLWVLQGPPIIVAPVGAGAAAPAAEAAPEEAPVAKKPEPVPRSLLLGQPMLDRAIQTSVRSFEGSEERLEKFVAEPRTDEEVRQFLSNAFGSFGGSGLSGGGYQQHRGGKDPALEYGREMRELTGIKGKRLIAEARRVLGIRSPEAPAKPAKGAKKAAEPAAEPTYEERLQPWLDRVAAATSVTELKAIQAELSETWNGGGKGIPSEAGDAIDAKYHEIRRTESMLGRGAAPPAATTEEAKRARQFAEEVRRAQPHEADHYREVAEEKGLTKDPEVLRALRDLDARRAELAKYEEEPAERPEVGERITYLDADDEEKSGFIDSYTDGHARVRRFGTRQVVEVPVERIAAYEAPEGAGALPFEEEEAKPAVTFKKSKLTPVRDEAGRVQFVAKPEEPEADRGRLEAELRDQEANLEVAGGLAAQIATLKGVNRLREQLGLPAKTLRKAEPEEREAVTGAIVEEESGPSPEKATRDFLKELSLTGKLGNRVFQFGWIPESEMARIQAAHDAGVMSYERNDRGNIILTNTDPGKLQRWLRQELGSAREPVTAIEAAEPDAPTDRPNVVFADVRGQRGNLIAYRAQKYDGTAEDASRVALELRDAIRDEFPDWSNVNTRTIATDEDGNPKWVISPNGRSVAEAGTPEAAYIGGDTTAKRPPLAEDQIDKLEADIAHLGEKARIAAAQRMTGLFNIKQLHSKAYRDTHARYLAEEMAKRQPQIDQAQQKIDRLRESGPKKAERPALGDIVIKDLKGRDVDRISTKDEETSTGARFTEAEREKLYGPSGRTEAERTAEFEAGVKDLLGVTPPPSVAAEATWPLAIMANASVGVSQSFNEGVLSPGERTILEDAANIGYLERVNRKGELFWKVVKQPELGDWLRRVAHEFLPLHMRATPSEAPEEAVAPPKAAAGKHSKQLRLAEYLVNILESTEGRISSEALFKAADTIYGGTRAEGAYQESDVYDVLETASNRIQGAFSPRQIPALLNALSQIEEYEAGIPLQVARTKEREQKQQFSTPFTYAEVVAWAANITPNDVVLEPSAGTGNILRKAIDYGPARAVGNEIDPRRGELLRTLPKVDAVYQVDAGHLHAQMAAKGEEPTVVVMNPPFSRDVKFTKRKIGTGLDHVLEAVKLVKPGGRVVAILGGGLSNAGPDGGASLKAPGYVPLWRQIAAIGDVRANVRVSGAIYRRFGTSFNTRLAIIDKPAEGVAVGGKAAPITGEVDSLEDLARKLNEVRNERVGPTAAAPARAGRGEEAAGARGETREGRPGPPGAVADRGGMAAPAAGAEAGARGRAVAAEGAESTGGVRGVRAEREAAVGEPRPAGKAGEAVAEEGGRGARGAAAPGDVGKGQQLPDRERSTVAVGRAERDAVATVNEEQVFDPYRPSLTFKGAKPHPTPLVESAAMSAIDYPEVDYAPDLPKEAIESGAISDAQLEPITYAGAAFEQHLPDGTRKGYFVGDGTGVGKSRIIGGILLDNWRRGRKKAVVFSPDDKLWENFRDELGEVGFPKGVLFRLPKMDEAIKKDTGILYVTYSTMIRETSDQGGAVTASRFDQILEWLGKDFDGVIAFDEAHKMGNSLEEKVKIGKKAPSQTGVKGYKLQSQVPDARILYASATGATNIANLAFAQRLGLWGEGTPFPTREDFVNQMTAGGISALEVVAQDMKRLGVYAARNLVLDVQYERLTHVLTPEQEAAYDQIAEAWGIILDNLNLALAATGMVEVDPRGNVQGSREATAARRQFYGSMQAFFNNLIVSLKMPTLIKAIEADLAAGYAPVIQVQHTGEAALTRILAQGLSDEELQDVELNTLGVLLHYLESAFPVAKIERFEDPETGAELTRVVRDEAGNPVLDPEAVKIRDRLIDKMSGIKLPELPVDQIIHYFGQKRVAEATGRKRRLVRDPKGRTIVEDRTNRHVTADIEAFQNDKKQILVFSIDAAGTGSNFHAALNRANQRLRRHYVAEGGWRAHMVIQALGRTHRSGQKQAPVWILVETNLPGEKRFMSTIARRLESLGALTKGSKEASGQSLYTELDNLENPWAVVALHAMFNQLGKEGLPTVAEFEKASGLSITTETGGLKAEGAMPDIPKFMNRLLGMKIADQNVIFDEFMTQFEMAIAAAKQSGEYDNGTEIVRAAGATVESEQTIRDVAGSKTKYVQIKLRHRNKVIPFDQLSNYWTSNRVPMIFKNTKSGRVWAVVAERSATDRKSGRMVQQYRMLGPGGVSQLVDTYKLGGRTWEQLEGDEAARAAWNEEARQVPEFRYEDFHLVHGALLPLWDRFMQPHPDIRRITTDDGRTFLGRQILQEDLKETLKRLGAAKQVTQLEPSEIFDRVLKDDYEVELSNGWIVMRRSVKGENRIEIKGPDWSWQDQLRQQGVLLERPSGSYSMRYFVPTNRITGPPVLERMMKGQQVSDVRKPEERGKGPEGGGLEDFETSFAAFPDPLAALISKLSESLAARRPPDDIFLPPALRTTSPEVEVRKQVARRGKVEEDVRGNALAAAKQVAQTMRSTFEHINPNDSATMALVYDVLRQYKGAAQFGRVLAYDEMRNITEKLGPHRLVLFTDYLALPDIIKDIEQGLYDEHPEDVPFGYSHPRFGEKYDPERDIVRDFEERVKPLVEANPDVVEAVNRRRQFQQSLTQKLVRLELLPAAVLKEPRYYHRQVLEHLNARQEGWLGASAGVDAHVRKKSFEKARVGGSDFNLAYYEAEFEYIAQAMSQIIKLETLERLEKLTNIVPQLKLEAKRLNMLRFEEAEAREAGVPLLDLQAQWALEPSSHPLFRFRSQIAFANQSIAKAAYEGTLQVPGWDHVVQELADAYGVWKDADKDTRGPFSFDHPQWFRFLATLGAQPDADIDTNPGPISALSIFKAIREREEAIRKRLGKKYRTWRDMIPETHAAWQPREGRHFFLAHTIPERVLERVLAGERQLHDEDVRDMLVVGGPRETWVIPKGLAQTLDGWGPQSESGVEDAAKWLLTSWKQWVLLNPLRAIRYNFNNMSGDVDIALAYDPGIFKHFAAAASDLWAFQVTGKQSREKARLMQDAVRRTVIDSGLTIAEIEDIKKTGAFKALVSATTHPNQFQRVVEGYWTNVKNLTVWRENILRLAAYRRFQERIAAGEKVYGASNKEQVDAITDPDDKAAKLARELIGDYGNISAAGQWLRSHLLPFYSWLEINAPRYVRMLRNLPHEGRGQAGAAAVLTTTIGLRTAKSALFFALKAQMLYGLVAIWNRTMFPDDDRRLHNGRKQLHIILGHRKDGSLITLRFEGALSDALEWFDLDDYPQDIQDLYAGKKNGWDMLSEAGKAPINRLIQSWEPFSKTTFEVVMGKSTFPEIFERGRSWRLRGAPIRNRFEHVARSVSMDWLVRTVSRFSDKPLPKQPHSEIPGVPMVGRALDAVLFYRTDPGEAAYWYTRHLVGEWQKKQGEEFGGYGVTRRSNALYYHRKALTWGDEKAADAWLREYVKLGGTSDGYRESLMRAHPLGSLSKPKQVAFLATLSKEDRDELQEAVQWYQGIYGGGR